MGSISSSELDAFIRNRPVLRINETGEYTQRGYSPHEHLTNTVVELLNTFVRDTKKSSCSPLLGLLVREVPDGVLERELLAAHCPDLRQDANLKPTH